ncbi:hypothetical protein BP5796_00866 [Coleophoma crateriformis]|uniref:Protein HRI1 n=1 Tax=Coleophoma crateriformis TaxID=565419 RepID=A0A3D8T966_9HELO|nr:hypothetical protein BP5796_00866 [Coleophoma crateriformis]
MAGLISTRLSLRWVPDEATEPTDTLVFNVGSYFMDLRILKADQSIDWGMAGTRDILDQAPLKCRWNKVIDSLGEAGSSDEGTFTKLPNGDDLETGSMPCPHKNDAVTEFEEVWKTLEPSKEFRKAWIVQSLDGMTFLGRIGDAFLGMRQSEDGFGARREALENGAWKDIYVVGKVPSVKEFPDSVDASKWTIGQEFELGGVAFVVRAVEEI